MFQIWMKFISDILDTLNINDSGSLVSLNLAGNYFYAEGAKHIAEVLPQL